MSDAPKPRSLALPLALAFTGGLALAALADGWRTPEQRVATPPPPSLEDVRPVAELSEAFISIAASVTPAVVQIQAEYTAPREQEGLLPSLREFFDPDAEQEEAPAQRPRFSGGTGFLVDGAGHILTNYHVVGNADQISVTLVDRRVLPAVLVGADPTTDVAVIRVDAEGLPAARLGDSEAAAVGEWVLAVGNPGFGPGGTLDFTVTSGIISAKGRPLQILQNELRAERDPAASYAIEDFIQTDAVINPGNSGGPLVNLRGEVVGVNTAIASGTGFYQGYGFAIPINLARRVMDDLIEHGAVRRPVLGISIRPVSAEDAQVYGLDRITGVLVQDFTAGSPAQDAGLRRHDVILTIDGRSVDRVGQLQRLVAQRRPGEAIRVGVSRYGKEMELDVQLAAAPFQPQVRTASTRPAADARAGLGLELVELTAAAARQIGFPSAGGAMVGAVLPGGPAERAGLFPGLRVLAVGRDEVGSARQARSLLRRLASGDVASLTLQSPDGGTSIVNIRVP